MKRLFLIIAMSITGLGLVVAQDLNEKVIEFVNANMGQKVGDGICSTLIVDAIENAKGEKLGRRRVKLFSNTYTYDYGKKISYKKIKPGDIVLYKKISHIGIVYEVGDNYIVTAEQNVLLPRQTTKKHSRVVLTEYEYDDKKVLKDYFVFYRPN
jgi:co-chaperonin GroES (HSP10)